MIYHFVIDSYETKIERITTIERGERFFVVVGNRFRLLYGEIGKTFVWKFGFPIYGLLN